MRTFWLMLAGIVVLSFAGTAPAQDKKDDLKAKLVGTWETKEGFTIEFTKDGKLTVTVKVEDKAISVGGTYSVEGNKLTVALKEGAQEKKETATIKKLDDKELVTVDAKGKEDTLKKKK